MNRSLLTVLATAAALLVPGAASAQAFPGKPVRLVVPWTPGGGVDTMARILQPKFAEGLGQPVVIDNRAGAAGTIGTDHVAKKRDVMQRRAGSQEARRGFHEGRAGPDGDLRPLSLLRVGQEATLEDDFDWPSRGGRHHSRNIALDEIVLTILEPADCQDHVDLVCPVANR